MHACMQVSEEDYNYDGKPDAINFVADVSGLYPIYSVKALVQFTYQAEVRGGAGVRDDESNIIYRSNVSIDTSQCLALR